jgi:hypothetical protein
MRTRVLIISVVTLALAIGVQPAVAGESSKLELRSFAGAYVPTGDMRDILEDAPVVGAQLAMELGGQVHAVASMGWAFSSDKQGADVHMSQYDLGLEVFETFDMSDSWTFRPFLGAGAGGRAYIFDGTDTPTERDFAGYGTLGAEFQLDRTALRLAARGYLTEFEGLDGNQEGVTRTDLSLSLGLAYHLR